MPLKNISKRLRVVEGGGVVFGDVVYAPGAAFGPRWQGDFQLVVILAGSVRIVVDGQELRVRAAEQVMLLPGRQEMFSWDEAVRTHHTWCAVDPAVVAMEPDLAEHLRDAPAVRPVPARVSQLIELGLGLKPGAPETTVGFVSSLGRAALQACVTVRGKVSSGSASEPLARMADWLGEHLAEEVNLDGLAKAAGVSPAQLVRLCKRELGETPLRYVWQMRTARGVQLLRDTGLPVAEIAWRCGFQTPFHFSRWVRDVEGAGPREVRRAAWNRPEI